MDRIVVVKMDGGQRGIEVVKVSDEWLRLNADSIDGVGSGRVGTWQAGRKAAAGGDDAGFEKASIGVTEGLQVSNGDGEGLKSFIERGNCQPSSPYRSKEDCTSSWHCYRHEKAPGDSMSGHVVPVVHTP